MSGEHCHYEMCFESWTLLSKYKTG